MKWVEARKQKPQHGRWSIVMGNDMMLGLAVYDSEHDKWSGTIGSFGDDDLTVYRWIPAPDGIDYEDLMG